MDKLKFVLFLIIVLALIGFALFWSINTIQSGTEYTKEERIEKLEAENKSLKKEVEDLKDEISRLESDKIAEEPKQEPTTATVQEPVVSTPTTTYKNQTLINALDKLIKDNIFMKLKSRGERVGTVQKFLNIYNKTSNKVDNDYGESTKTAVAAFQKDQGLSADGEAGPSTFSKMIDWLKKQG